MPDGFPCLLRALLQLFKRLRPHSQKLAQGVLCSYRRERQGPTIATCEDRNVFVFFSGHIIFHLSSVAILLSVGDVTSRTLLARLPELGKPTHKQIGALVGVAPFARQSGQWKGEAHIRGDRAEVRT